MPNLWRDVRYALRTLWKNPGFALIGIVTLALGMAVNTTIFSIVNGILLRPLPVPKAEQLTVLTMQQPGDAGPQNFSHPDYEELKAEAGSIGEVFGYRVALVGMTADGKGAHCIVSRVTSNYFSVLGVTPALGRLILPSEGRAPGADPIVVLGHSYWHKQFAGDKDVVGKKVEINGLPFTVVGVAPEEFHGTYALLDMDAYLPYSARTSESPDDSIQTDWTSRKSRLLTLMARLKPGVSLREAGSSLNVLAQRIAEEHPDTDKGMTVQVYPEHLARPIPDPNNTLPKVALAFTILAGLVLLVACFNIANVLLIRATVRQREMAIRAALGAGRGRLVRQYLTESLLLAFFGGGAGLVLAGWASSILGSLQLGTDLPIHFDFHADSRVYLFALAAVILTGVIVGLVPALRIARTDVNSVLHEGGRGSSDGPRRQFARNSLVAAQVAGSMVLLIVAGLFMRSLGKAENLNLGFNPDHILNLSVDVGQVGYKEERGREFYRELDSRLRSIPGVESVAQAFTIPLGYISAINSVYFPERPVESGKPGPVVSYNSITPDYFETFRIPLERGRDFTDADDQKAPAVAVINQTMAKKFWPNEDAVGKRFSIKGNAGPFIEVVGVVHDAKYGGITEDPQPFFYLPLSQNYNALRTIHVRTSVPPENLALQVEAQIRELIPNLPISQVQTMTQSLQGANGFFFFRFGAQLTATMGVLGLILAVVGIYSVVSYAAAQRTHEIGIRVALGAAQKDILRMVLRQGIGVVSTGLIVGLLLALAGTRAISALIVGVSPSDPLTFSAVIILLASIALMACWIPARRATRVDPLVALRYE